MADDVAAARTSYWLGGAPACPCRGDDPLRHRTERARPHVCQVRRATATLQCFRTMSPAKYVVSWNTMISAQGRAGEHREALMQLWQGARPTLEVHPSSARVRGAYDAGMWFTPTTWVGGPKECCRCLVVSSATR